MLLQKALAIFLITAGSISLIYGGFTYTRENHETEIGPFNLSVDERERITVPLWAGLASIVAGVSLLLLRKTR